MNEVWNLDPIYKGFDDPSFAEDMTALEKVAGELTAFAQTLSASEPLEGLKKGIALQEQFSDLVNKLAGFASLRQAANTRDAEAGSRMGQIMAVYSGVAAPLAGFQEWASKLPNLMELVTGDEELKDYAFLFQNEQENSQTSRKLLYITGSPFWSSVMT